MATHIIIAMGASRVGRGISSVIWVIASNPMSDNLKEVVSKPSVVDKALRGFMPPATEAWIVLGNHVLQSVLVDYSFQYLDKSCAPPIVTGPASKPHHPATQSRS